MRFAVIATLVFAGCSSSPPMDYYTLSMEPSGGAEPGFNVTVERLLTTEPLARQQILIAASSTRIEYYARANWAASVGELVQRKLQAELGRPREGRPGYVLSGTVTAAEQVDVPGGAEARLEIQAVIREAGSMRYQEPRLVQTFAATQPAAAARPGAVVEALSVCAERVAADIADAVSGLGVDDNP